MIGPLVVLLLMLALSSLWVFFRFQPYVEQPKVRALTLVNRLFVGLGSVMALAAAARVYSMYAPSAEAPSLLPGLAASWALALFFICVTAGFILRNFVIFRTSRYI